MKRPLRCFDKIRIFNKWLKNQNGFGLICSCDLCNSTKIRRLEFQTEMIDGAIEYFARYECLNCGGFAEAKEVWAK